MRIGLRRFVVCFAQVIGMTYDELTDAFKAGRVGMIQERAHRYGDIVKVVGADNVELAKMPSDDPAKPSPSVITGWGMGIPVGSKNPEAAWEYIHNYISAEALGRPSGRSYSKIHHRADLNES